MLFILNELTRILVLPNIQLQWGFKKIKESHNLIKIEIKHKNAYFYSRINVFDEIILVNFTFLLSLPKRWDSKNGRLEWIQ